MLQQTRVESVKAYFFAWMKRYPNISALSEASLSDLYLLWQGLGYYSRCENIYKSAQIIVREHEGLVPNARGELLALPGIGEYTAGAILSIAYEQQEPIVDGNIKRVFARLFGYAHNIDTTEAYAYFTQQSTTLVNLGNPRNINQSLMELGALVCTKTSPKCPTCPVQKYCYAHTNEQIESLPKKKPKTVKTELTLYHYVFICGDEVLLVKNAYKKWWKNLYGFLCFEDKKEMQILLRETGANLVQEMNISHTVTRYKVHSKVAFWNVASKRKLVLYLEKEGVEFVFSLMRNLGKYQFSSVGKRVREELHSNSNINRTR